MNDKINFMLSDEPIEFILNGTLPESNEVSYRLLEDGERRLDEDGNFRILE